MIVEVSDRQVVALVLNALSLGLMLACWIPRAAYLVGVFLLIISWLVWFPI